LFRAVPSAEPHRGILAGSPADQRLTFPINVELKGPDLVTAQSPATLPRTHVHPQSDAVARSGWRICAPRDPDRRVIRQAGRTLRITLCDGPFRDGEDGEHARWDLVRAAGSRLAMGAPSRIVPPAAAWAGASQRERAGIVSGTGATVFDLYRDGRVDVACWDCPSLVHLRCDGTVGLLSPLPAGGSGLTRMRPGERLLGLTAELLQVLPPQALLGLAEAARADGNACEVWQRYAAAAREAGATGPAPGLVVVTRARS
jgi:hypothetical protein